MRSKLPHSQRDSDNGSAMPLYLKVANAAVLVLGAVATINSFRSVWYLLDSYFIPGEYDCFISLEYDRQKMNFPGNHIMSCLHGLFYGALLCALFGITPSLYMGTVMRDESLSGIPIYFLTNQFVNYGN